ncbi:MAG TPA: TonB-dependent receptor, partial [Chitinophagaceae bacterium]|nr:TonB-dependent receptor [Chitinophagaceae bacterium]
MNVKAQKDSVDYFTSDSIASLKEVVVSGIIPARAKETSWNITSLPQKNMRASGAYSIADALAKIPGISQLNTSVGISKPVIRGLYGNRILAVLSGMRFDNQQWQDEHGLGLNDMGIDRVEIIKGPAGLLYGSEAIGGALHIIEEQPAKPGTASGEVNTRFFTNTLGTFTDVGFKGATQKNNWRIRAGINSQADYTDGDGKRILNSRFGGYYLKGSFGFTKKNWTSVNHYSGSIDQFGFITEDNLNSKKPDGRWSRSMDGPHHKVILNVLSSQNTIKLRQSVLKLNVGAQSNLRLEDEGGSEISLKMLLSSAIYNLQWIKTISQHTQFILGNNFLYQNNTNYGKRIIVPDANTMEAGGAVYLKNKWNKIILETGVGFSLRNIQTKETGNVNAPSSEIQPFNITKPIVNASMGAVANLTKSLNLKLNASSGFRSGNLAELSSNGLHEGTLRYEIGDPNLKIEQNINTELGINWQSEYLLLSVAAFYNYFSNYIYLTPTGD